LVTPHIAIIADKRFYADAVRSIEYGALSRFLRPRRGASTYLRDYFGGFDLILSYLSTIRIKFSKTVLAAMWRQKEFCAVPPRIIPGTHGHGKLARPLQELGINVIAIWPQKFFHTDEDRGFAGRFLQNCDPPVLALHPGSGSERKNWPIEKLGRIGKDFVKREGLVSHDYLRLRRSGRERDDVVANIV